MRRSYFICNFFSSSTDFNPRSCFNRFTFVFLFRSDFSRPSIPRFASFPFNFLPSAVLAFFRLLQFWILTTKPLFLPFPHLPVSASQWLLQCSSSALTSYVFHIPSCLISRAFFPVSGTRTYCMFPFILPWFAPTAVPQVLTFNFRILCCPFHFCFLSSTSDSLPTTQPSVSPFPFLPVSASQRLFQCSFSTFVSNVFPVISCLISYAFLHRFSYSAFWWFPFVLSCFAPAAVPQVIPFKTTVLGTMLDLCFLSSTLVLALNYSAFVSSFPLSF